MTGLFDHALQNVLESESPLAARLRPRSFAEFVGQVHIIGAGDLPPAADCGARLARGAPPVELGVSDYPLELMRRRLHRCWTGALHLSSVLRTDHPRGGQHFHTPGHQ